MKLLLVTKKLIQKTKKNNSKLTNYLIIFGINTLNILISFIHHPKKTSFKFK